MSTRGKRPFESRSRGDSPPEKRSRPLEQQSAAQDRYAKPGSPAIPSPPLSRTGSLAGLPANVPTGPRRRSDQYRKQSDRRDDESGRGGLPPSVSRDARIMSPSSIGSGAGTPTGHAAPPAPSMLPAAISLHLLQRQNEATGELLPISMHSLRNLQERKRAIAYHAKATILNDDSAVHTVPPKLEASIKAHQYDIAHLKKERDEAKKERDDVTKKLETLSNRLVDLERKDISEVVAALLQPLHKRLDAIDEGNLDTVLTNLRADLDKLKPALGPSDPLEKTQPILQASESLTLQNQITQLNSLPERINKLEAASSKHADQAEVISGLKDDIGALRSAKELQKIGIGTLISWKNGLPETMDKVAVKQLVVQEVAARTANAKTLQRDVKAMETRLSTRITGNEEEVKRLDEQAKTGLDFKATMQKLNIPAQLDRLSDRIKAVEDNESRTYDKASRNQDKVENLEKTTKSLGNRVDTLRKATDKRVEGLEFDVETYIGRIKAGFLTTKSTVVQRLNKLEEHELSVAQRFDELEKHATSSTLPTPATPGPGFKKVGKPVTPLSPKPNDSFTSIAQLDRDVKALQQDLEEMKGLLEENENTFHQHANEISCLQKSVPQLFTENFDPFKLKIQEELSTVNSKLEADRSRLEAPIQPQSSFGVAEQAQLQSTVQTLDTLKADVGQLQASLNAETAVRGQELLSKADKNDMNQQMDQLKFAINDFASRFNNITTDELHQQMVRWFVQMYPSNSMVLKQCERLQQEVDRLKSFEDQASWVRAHSHILSTLFKLVPQLQELANKAPELQTLVNKVSPSALEKIDQACSEAKTAATKADDACGKMDEHAKTVESLRVALTGLQQSFRNLNSDTSPFAKTEALSNVEETMKTLKSTINELRTTFGEAHETRVKVEGQMKSSIRGFEQVRAALEPRVNNLAGRIDEIQASSSQIQQDFDKMNTLVESNREFFGLIGKLLLVGAQLQQVVENLNQNLPKGPMKLDWVEYLPTLSLPNTNTNTNEKSSGKGKGKSKSKQ
ncbi:hypothetical protein BDW02DRAFT_296136 [Decorospora gaudefroyi]|uniref:Uncharacterized protein n=1 Tax=Decorospora gaudefroyi TaxID=184978 RepID=A0A6A5KBE1_9PLEO|nr:hypothetical protein BDW02DRAFT_296136 [Decorospora gaudefroyi]